MARSDVIGSCSPTSAPLLVQYHLAMKYLYPHFSGQAIIKGCSNTLEHVGFYMRSPGYLHYMCLLQSYTGFLLEYHKIANPAIEGVVEAPKIFLLQ